MSGRSLAAALGLVFAVLAFPAVVPTQACSAEGPTIEDVARGARLIFLGRIVKITEVVSAPDKYEMQVERRMRGDVGGRVTLTEVKIGLCHDDLTLAEPRVGQRLVIARGFPFRGDILDAYWRIRGDDSVGNSIPDTDLASLEDLQRALVGEMPDTASTSLAPVSKRAVPDRPGFVALFLLAAAVGGLYVARRPRGLDR